MSTRTEFMGVETRLGDVNLSAGVATISLISRYLVYRTNYRTNYRTVTYSIVSQIATAVYRTYELEYGNIKSQIITVIPTQLVLDVKTYTITGGGGKEGSQPEPVPAPAPKQASPIAPLPM